RISTSAICSASTMALRTSSAAAAASAISPLRTPRERACPTPTMFRVPAEFTSPTTAQTFDVPISSPTMMDEESNMFSFIKGRFGSFGRRRGHTAVVGPQHRRIIADGQFEGVDHFAAALRFVMNRMPAAQLSVEIREAKRYFIALTGADDEDISLRDVD